MARIRKAVTGPAALAESLARMAEGLPETRAGRRARIERQTGRRVAWVSETPRGHLD